MFLAPVLWLIMLSIFFFLYVGEYVFCDVHVGFFIYFLSQTFFSPSQTPFPLLKPRRFPPIAHLRRIDVVMVDVSAAVTIYPSVLMAPMSLIVRRTQEAWWPQYVSPSSL